MQVQEMKLTELLSDVESGRLVIPDFQRDFVWTKKQIEDLLKLDRQWLFYRDALVA